MSHGRGEQHQHPPAMLRCAIVSPGPVSGCKIGQVSVSSRNSEIYSAMKCHIDKDAVIWASNTEDYTATFGRDNNQLNEASNVTNVLSEIPWKCHRKFLVIRDRASGFRETADDISSKKLLVALLQREVCPKSKVSGLPARLSRPRPPLKIGGLKAAVFWQLCNWTATFTAHAPNR